MIKPNVDPNSSKPSTYADERIFSNVVNALRRQCDDGWTKKTWRVREVHNGETSDDVWRATVDCSFGCLCLGVPRDGLMEDKSRLILLTYLGKKQSEVDRPSWKIVESSGNPQLSI